jgi:hypothetical protein
MYARIASVVPATVTLKPSSETRIFPPREREVVRVEWKEERSSVALGGREEAGRDGGAEKYL